MSYQKVNDQDFQRNLDSIIKNIDLIEKNRPLFDPISNNLRMSRSFRERQITIKKKKTEEDNSIMSDIFIDTISKW